MFNTAVNLHVLNLIEGILYLMLAVKLLHISQLLESVAIKNSFHHAENGLNWIVVWTIGEIEDWLNV